MARKATVTESSIIDAAFSLMRDEGFEQVTARKLAARVGCSTQPIFRLYESMDRLIAELYTKAIQYFEEFCQKEPGHTELPFIDLGMSYIRFSIEEKNIFRLLFISRHRGEKSMYELLNGSTNVVSKEVARAKSQGVADPGSLFLKVWIFVHGAACMSLTGDYDLTMDETYGLLKDVYQAYIR